MVLGKGLILVSSTTSSSTHGLNHVKINHVKFNHEKFNNVYTMFISRTKTEEEIESLDLQQFVVVVVMVYFSVALAILHLGVFSVSLWWFCVSLSSLTFRSRLCSCFACLMSLCGCIRFSCFASCSCFISFLFCVAEVVIQSLCVFLCLFCVSFTAYVPKLFSPHTPFYILIYL